MNCVGAGPGHEDGGPASGRHIGRMAIEPIAIGRL
jgi:hypothetical protein